MLRASHTPDNIIVSRRLMGGDLTVISVYGQGSTFTVRLPSMVRERLPQPVLADTLGRCVINPRF